MYKSVSLVKRKAGTTREQFKTYYEMTHSKLGEKHLPPYCVKYLRRYIEPIAHPTGGPPAEPDFDCLVEMWFPDLATYSAFRASVSSPELTKIIVADEEAFIDRAATRRYLVEEERQSFGPE